MSKARVFQCPNCGASLDYDGGDELTVQCPYCSGAVIVPEELRDKEPIEELGQPIRAKTIVVGSVPELIQSASRSGLVEPARTAGRIVGCTGAIVTLGFVGFILVTIVAVMITIPRFTQESLEPVEAIPRPMATFVAMRSPGPVETAAPSFARVALTFGGEGIGPGLFTDARCIAVDGEGNIYVGEYSDGRIQVFDASGQFVSLWMVESEAPLRGLAADRQGTVYVVQGGEISRYEGATGKLLDKIEYAEGRGFDDITVAADGGLVAVWRKTEDNIVRFDAQGNVVQTIRAAISEQSGRSESNARVAADGLGNIYALGTSNNAVFKFAPDGKFVTRFGSEGQEPGQVRGPLAIAVDSQGRVYVSDFKGIQAFDTSGRYLDLVKVDGPAFGMVFNDQNELFVAARHKVIKYVLHQ